MDEASSGGDALKALEAALEEGEPFHIALVDMQMPDMDGLMVAQSVRHDARHNPTRIVLLTSLGMDREVAARKGGVLDACLEKPVRHRDLLQALSKTVAAPIRTENTAPAPRREEARNVTGLFSGMGVRLLLVEDNLVNQQVAVRLLAKLGLQAEIAGNGVQALKALAADDFDLVLMDVQMPEMDGYEATRRIRDLESDVRRHDIPIIAMTAHAMQGDRQRCLEAGMSDYIPKPINPIELATVLERWLPAHGKGDAMLEVTAFPAPPACVVAAAEAKGIWDWESLMDRLMGDPELLRDVVEAFLEDMPNQFVLLRRHVDTEDPASAALYAHSIKGASANVSAEALRVWADKLEDSCRAGDFATARGLLTELSALFEQVSQAMVQKVSPEGSSLDAA